MGELIPLYTSEDNRLLRRRERSALLLELAIGDLPKLTRLLMHDHNKDNNNVTRAAGLGSSVIPNDISMLPH